MKRRILKFLKAFAWTWAGVLVLGGAMTVVLPLLEWALQLHPLAFLAVVSACIASFIGILQACFD